MSSGASTSAASPGKCATPPLSIHQAAPRDSITLAIAHKEGDMGVLDCIREVKPPFSPEGVVAEFADLLKTYRITKVRGDRYAGEWPREQFASAASSTSERRPQGHPLSQLLAPGQLRQGAIARQQATGHPTDRPRDAIPPAAAGTASTTHAVVTMTLPMLQPVPCCSRRRRSLRCDGAPSTHTGAFTGKTRSRSPRVFATSSSPSRKI